MSAEKRKGDVFERGVAVVFRACGHPDAERVLRLGARDDRGDITGIGAVHLDCKNHARLQLAAWVDEVVAEAPPGTLPCVVVKRARAPIARAYVVIELATFARLIAPPHYGNGAA